MEVILFMIHAVVNEEESDHDWAAAACRELTQYEGGSTGNLYQ